MLWLWIFLFWLCKQKLWMWTMSGLNAADERLVYMPDGCHSFSLFLSLSSSEPPPMHVHTHPHPTTTSNYYPYLIGVVFFPCFIRCRLSSLCLSSFWSYWAVILLMCCLSFFSYTHINTLRRVGIVLKPLYFQKNKTKCWLINLRL